MESEEFGEYLDKKKERFYSKISFWVSMVLSVGIVGWYYVGNPPDSDEVMEMRIFFNKNKLEVGKFFKLSAEEEQRFVQEKKHPFYINYLKSSEVEKERIRALAHISYDYTPYQYWFNLMFLWIIFLTTFWFLGLMVEGVLILVEKESAKRRKKSTGD